MVRVVKRGVTYSVRILVPVSLHATLPKEIRRSLNTRSHTVANLRAGVIMGKASALFLYLHQHQEHHGMSTNQVKELIAQYIDGVLESGENDRAMLPYITEELRESNMYGLSIGIDGTREALLSNDLTLVHETADELLQRGGVTLEKDSLEYRRFCRALMRAQIAVFETERERWDSGGIDGVVRPSTPSASPEKIITKLFSEVMAVYFKEHHWVPRNAKQIQSGLTQFMEIIGGDKPIGDITKADCRLYKDTLLKSAGANTTNKKLNSVGHLWNWAQGQGFLPDGVASPITGLRLNKRVEKKERLERKPFTDAHLSAILSHSHFQAQRVRHPERYWLVLGLLLTGARRRRLPSSPSVT